MLSRLHDFIRRESLFAPADRLLVAVSGGLDSIVLTRLLHEGGYKIGLAHCNFRLRGEESDADEVFVRQLAQALDLPFYSESWPTQAIARQRGVGIQVAARELRYEWLEIIRQSNGFDWIATAHQLNDAMETLLFHLAKGCGIHGIQGIPPKNGRVVRPLLFATREEVEQFAAERRLPYREDASNTSDKYDRNRIRRHAVPVFKAINPALERTMQENLQRFKAAEYLFNEAVDMYKSRWVQAEDRELRINLAALRTHPHAHTLLVEWLSPLGFHPDQLAQALDNTRQTGAYFDAAGYRLLLDREALLVQPHTQQDPTAIYEIKAGEGIYETPAGLLKMSLHQGAPDSFSADNNIALFDAATLNFPLRLRKWKSGDWFCPIGMHGQRKKLQDFFSDAKLSRFDKENVWLLENAGSEIVWVIGYRMDERFKIHPFTAQYWRFELSME